MDNLSGYELVLPNGTVTTVTESSYPDLFWGLKGGYNNFVSTVLQLPCANEYAYLRSYGAMTCLVTFRPLNAIHPSGHCDQIHAQDLPTDRGLGTLSPPSRRGYYPHPCFSDNRAV